ncbi:MAG: FAD-binding oxidoreductase, partial [Proteobacteria bacterium]|nr:FAD-binding oxidoreductase [Pseudomonadota bacterium]
ALAVDLFERYTTLEIRRLASRWAGLRTFARDQQPVAGFDPGEPGFFWLAGQGGGGIMSSPALGELAATLVRGAPWPARASELGLEPADLAAARFAAGA